MEVASSFPQIHLSFLFLVFAISPISSATCPSTNKLPLSIPQRQAQKLIRNLNLCPKHSTNIVSADTLFVPQGDRVVETKLIFPKLVAPGPSVQDFGHHAGYYSLPNSKAARMFYLFFESRNSRNDPVVIWLTGGPGCSSQLALFYENGPFHITQNLTLSWNDYGWDKVSNIIFVDQPVGTGFSYSSDQSDIPHDEEGVSNALFDFLQAFFKEHPQFRKNDFYIAGESYAGHYIPVLASRVQKANKANEGIHINLRSHTGIAIGNGLTNPAIQYPAYTDFALENGLIQKDDYDRINQLIPSCSQSIQACGREGGDACLSSYTDCQAIFGQILSVTGNNINYYDIRKECEGELCYDFSGVERLLNEREVKEALGVNEELEFVSCSSEVYDSMAQDWMRNLAVGIPALLEDGIKVLVYAGEQDLICNWLGNWRWVHAMKWSGQKQFGASPNVTFLVDGKQAGTLKTHEPLTFLKVTEAGHMVPMDQPKAALEMLTRWMQAKLSSTSKPI
ncbi:serine carboxypeptidase-like [Neltuma alba]|uniref:serine carboxypeptidase-like n=1 Tax=Neltuma alba TaxID=207710 RepID=UPI0010A52A1E|nr:serine carboxypeptidase-like [Prosopis alba]